MRRKPLLPNMYGKIACLVSIAVLIGFYCCAQPPKLSAADSILRRRAADRIRQLTEQDHQRIMDLLHISALRPGANGSNPQAPNAANYDEAKTNPASIPGGIHQRQAKWIIK